MAESQPEQIKGKYVLGPCIRSGGMGVVFAGWTKGVDGFLQRVAIKRIHPHHSRNPLFREQFASEARLSSYLRHGNIVRVFDFDEDETGSLFLVMEYVDGVELDVLARTGRLPLPVVLFVAGELLRALSYVHELPAGEGVPLGLVHRDVSPHNVLISWDGTVQLADFGIAKARNATLAGASATRGKDGYMSPEQACGQPLDGRSDVFSLGVMLWEMLSGEPLFRHPNGDPHGTTTAPGPKSGPGPDMFYNVPLPRASVPRDVESVTMRLLQRRPEDRYNATAALTELTSCVDFPRNGRDALASLLHDRFPQLAPKRTQPAPTEETRERPRPLEMPTPGFLVKRRYRSHRRNALLAAIALFAAGCVAYAVLHGPGFYNDADSMQAPVLELPLPIEPPAPPSTRLAAPEHAAEAFTDEDTLPRKLPPPTRPSTRKPSESSTRKPPAESQAPERRGIQVIDLSPGTTEPAGKENGQNSWIHL